MIYWVSTSVLTITTNDIVTRVLTITTNDISSVYKCVNYNNKWYIECSTSVLTMIYWVSTN